MTFAYDNENFLLVDDQVGSLRLGVYILQNCKRKVVSSNCQDEIT